MTTSPISEWRDFYEMIGTASGVIVGATFVVASLASGLKEGSLGMRGFISPTAVYLGSVLVSSAILTAPTLSLTWLALLLGVGGLAGMVYGIVVATRIWRMKLDFVDRSFYIALPIAAFAAMAAAAFMARFTGGPALEILAISLVVLLVTGMRNAWDMATFMITRDRQG